MSAFARLLLVLSVVLTVGIIARGGPYGHLDVGLHSLELVDAGEVRPALIIGMPVGFIAAAESKQALVERAIPCITVAGTRGGSPLGAAALNALARLALPSVAGML